MNTSNLKIYQKLFQLDNSSIDGNSNTKTAVKTCRVVLNSVSLQSGPSTPPNELEEEDVEEIETVFDSYV